jgi:hypothetical protein
MCCKTVIAMSGHKADDRGEVTVFDARIKSRPALIKLSLKST